MWGELPYKKDRSARRKFWKEPLKGTKILFYGHSLKCFSPLRRNNSETTQLTMAVFFSAQDPTEEVAQKLLLYQTYIFKP